ncbi:hypothetical protein LOTGIDRAFT_238843 [Lottia gigantea]|uniref:Uncharacterized protein n=1 Tax=Lottia gigantea TaxID=225164 RepID=V4A5B4_LOTGI|nr:hypothetical protein LOTGIDRAFT_238843 [Lottia gigantea]ESO99113.1 hypothetical protein LOTGIDRAFT_238843 [Lottia gigantea]
MLLVCENIESKQCGDCPADESPAMRYAEPSRIARVISEFQGIKQSFITHVERKSLETALILVAIAMSILILGSFIQWWRKGHPVLTDYILLPHEEEQEIELKHRKKLKELSNGKDAGKS